MRKSGKKHRQIVIVIYLIVIGYSERERAVKTLVRIQLMSFFRQTKIVSGTCAVPFNAMICNYFIYLKIAQNNNFQCIHTLIMKLGIAVIMSDKKITKGEFEELTLAYLLLRQNNQ